MRHAFSLSLVAACIALGAACSDVHDDSPEVDASTPDAGDSMRVPDELVCRRQSELDMAAEPFVLDGSSAPVLLAPSAQGLWVAQFDKLVFVPAGASVESARYHTETQRIHGLIAGDGEALVMLDDELVRVAADGTSTPVAPIARGARLDVTSYWPFAFDADNVYTVVQGDTDLELVALTRSTGARRRVAVLDELPWRIAVAGSELVWSATADAAHPYYSRLLAVDVAGGEVREVPVDVGTLRIAFDLLDARAGHALIDVGLSAQADNSDNSALSVPGVYRVDLTDGSAEKRVEADALAFNIFDLFGAGDSTEALSGTRDLVRTGSIGKANVYDVSAGAEVERALCVELGEGYAARMAEFQGDLYMALVDGSTLSVVRYAL